MNQISYNTGNGQKTISFTNIDKALNFVYSNAEFVTKIESNKKLNMIYLFAALKEGVNR